jgi:hypothetical protein
VVEVAAARAFMVERVAYRRDGVECEWYPRQDSNLRTRFRKPTLYPLSYGGV